MGDRFLSMDDAIHGDAAKTEAVRRERAACAAIAKEWMDNTKGEMHLVARAIYNDILARGGGGGG